MTCPEGKKLMATKTFEISVFATEISVTGPEILWMITPAQLLRVKLERSSSVQ